MIVKDLEGKSRSVTSIRYKIDWGKKSLSTIQNEVKKALFENWQYDSVFEEFPCSGTKTRLDFFNKTKMIAIEVDGPQHDQYNPFFHKNRRANYVKQKERDDKKEKWCKVNGIKLFRVKKIEDLYECK